MEPPKDDITIHLLKDKNQRLIAFINNTPLTTTVISNYYLPKCDQIKTTKFNSKNIFPFIREKNTLNFEAVYTLSCPPPIWKNYLFLECHYTKTEKLRSICMKRYLNKIDRILNRYYKRARYNAKSTDRLRDEQRNWVKARNSKCKLPHPLDPNHWIEMVSENYKSAICAYRVTQDRINELIKYSLIGKWAQQGDIGNDDRAWVEFDESGRAVMGGERGGAQAYGTYEVNENEIIIQYKFKYVARLIRFRYNDSSTKITHESLGEYKKIE